MPPTKLNWHDPERIPGATYSVAAVDADGEGPASTPGPADTVPGAPVATRTSGQIYQVDGLAVRRT